MFKRVDPRMQRRNVDDSETEWDAAQRRIGNLAPKEIEVTQEEILALAEEAIANYDPLEHKRLDELDELEEEVGDDVLRGYREARLREMMDACVRRRRGRRTDAHAPADRSARRSARTRRLAGRRRSCAT